MRVGKLNILLWISCLGWSWPGCDDSVTVETPPSQNSGVKVTIPTIPGTQDPIETPVVLSTDCKDPATSDLTLNYYATLARSPLSGNNFIMFWTVCNAGGQPRPAGGSYDFVIKIEAVNSQSADQPQLTPFKTTPIPIPELDGCHCYEQEVGINMNVDPAVLQQASVKDQGLALATQFPSITVPANQPPQSNLTFKYQASLLPPSGITAPNTMTFTIQ